MVAERPARGTRAAEGLRAGVQPNHASIGITLDTYSHVMPGMQEEAAAKIDAGLRSALAKQGWRVYDDPAPATPHARLPSRIAALNTAQYAATASTDRRESSVLSVLSLRSHGAMAAAASAPLVVHAAQAGWSGRSRRPISARRKRA